MHIQVRTLAWLLDVRRLEAGDDKKSLHKACIYM